MKAVRRARRPRSVSRDDVVDLMSVDMSDPDNSGWFRVTPKLATKVIEDHAGFNRDIGAWKRLAETMRDGRFVDFHPQGGMFDEDGNLRDGLNRLRAIVASDHTAIMRFQCGCTEEEIKRADCGKSRSLGDRVAIERGKRGRKMAAMAFKFATQAKPPRVEPFEDELEAYEQFLVDHEQGLEWLESAFPVNVPKVTRAPILLALMEFYERHPEAASRFVAALLDKSQTMEPQAARVLKMTLLVTDGGGWSVNDRLYGNAIYCCKKALRNEKTTKMELGEWDNNRLTKRRVNPKSHPAKDGQRPRDLPGQKRMAF